MQQLIRQRHAPHQCNAMCGRDHDEIKENACLARHEAHRFTYNSQVFDTERALPTKGQYQWWAFRIRKPRAVIIPALILSLFFCKITPVGHKIMRKARDNVRLSFLSDDAERKAWLFCSTHIIWGERRADNIIWLVNILVYSMYV